MPKRFQGVRETAIALCALGLILSVVAARLVRENFSNRVPFDPWTTAQTASWSVAEASGMIVCIAGAWLVWRLPSNPTGWWVLATGIAFAAWIAGTYWPAAPSPWAERLLPTVFTATIVMAVLPWPTGRLERRWARPFRRSMLAFVVIGVASQFIGYRIPLWPQGWHLPSIGGLFDELLMTTFTAVLLHGLAPALFLAAIIRRHMTMPAAVRSSVLPALWGAGLLAVSELWIFTFDVILAPLQLQTETPWRQLRTIRDVVALGRFGVVALLLVLAELLRRRAAASKATEHRVELGPLLEHADPAFDTKRVLGDPSARLLVRGTDEIEERVAGRSRIELVDSRGALAAVVEYNPRVVVTPATCDALIVTVELAVLRRVREAEAHSRTRELRSVQRAVLDAQDRARRRLERDLHDGAQQRLVALSLEASMFARREQTQRRDEAGRAALVESIESSIELTRAIVGTSVPAVVDSGLAAGLAALDATVAMPSTLQVDGDLSADHPAAAVLWFVASEAVANTLKHSHATKISVRLRVDDHVAELTVRDDGIGGTFELPGAIVRRLAGVPSTVHLDSTPGHGTTLRVCIELKHAEVLV